MAPDMPCDWCDKNEATLNVEFHLRAVNGNQTELLHTYSVCSLDCLREIMDEGDLES